MIQIKCQNERFAYDMYHIVKSFFPDAEIIQTIDREQESLIWIQIDRDSCFLGCREAEGHEFTIMPSEVEALSEGTPQKRYVNKKLYRMLEELTGQTHAWGNMTGVRPTKMIMMHLDQGETEEEATQYMYDTFLVTPKKTRLGIEIARREREQLSKLDYENGYSLYIHIPFCPTICSYCSFNSYPVERWTKRLDAYVDALMKEIIAISRMMKGKKLNTVYMGGGTPTALSAEQMDRVLGCVETHFSYEYLKEFTVEAGRPDSITREKLQVIYDHGVRRISINPQSMQQRTLDEIGRCHTVQDIIDTFHMAREIGFTNINMDLIAGLPGESPEDMADTLRKIKELDPDNLTVHALAMKHGSRMTREVKEGKSENVLSNSETARQLRIISTDRRILLVILKMLAMQKKVAQAFIIY